MLVLEAIARGSWLGVFGELTCRIYWHWCALLNYKHVLACSGHWCPGIRLRQCWMVESSFVRVTAFRIGALSQVLLFCMLLVITIVNFSSSLGCYIWLLWSLSRVLCHFNESAVQDHIGWVLNRAFHTRVIVIVRRAVLVIGSEQTVVFVTNAIRVALHALMRFLLHFVSVAAHSPFAWCSSISNLGWGFQLWCFLSYVAVFGQSVGVYFRRWFTSFFGRSFPIMGNVGKG